jgi:hypothetical protein
MPIYVLRKKDHSRESRKNMSRRGLPASTVGIPAHLKSSYESCSTPTCLQGAFWLAPPMLFLCLTSIYAGKRHQAQAKDADRVLVTYLVRPQVLLKSSWQFLCRTSPQVMRWNMAPLRRSPAPRRGG